MNRLEARRYAHKIAATALRGAEAALALEPLNTTDDMDLVLKALGALAEYHERLRPKSTDRAPRTKARHETPLFDERPAEQRHLEETNG